DVPRRPRGRLTPQPAAIADRPRLHVRPEPAGREHLEDRIQQRRAQDMPEPTQLVVGALGHLDAAAVELVQGRPVEARGVGAPPAPPPSRTPRSARRRAGRPRPRGTRRAPPGRAPRRPPAPPGAASGWPRSRRGSNGGAGRTPPRRPRTPAGTSATPTCPAAG